MKKSEIGPRDYHLSNWLKVVKNNVSVQYEHVPESSLNKFKTGIHSNGYFIFKWFEKDNIEKIACFTHLDRRGDYVIPNLDTSCEKFINKNLNNPRFKF